MFPFEWLTREHKLSAIYQTLLENKELVMGLQEQVATLSERVGTLETAVSTLATKVDAEQAQVQAALDLLTLDNPDVAAAITRLESVAANLGAITTDVESTIPDTPSEPPA